MKIKITSTDRLKWFVAYYGTGAIVDVLDETVGDFFELTPAGFKRAKEDIAFFDPNIVRLFIPMHSAEVVDVG